jgi:hypothetical protein
MERLTRLDSALGREGLPPGKDLPPLPTVRVMPRKLETPTGTPDAEYRDRTRRTNCASFLPGNHSHVHQATTKPSAANISPLTSTDGAT